MSEKSIGIPRDDDPKNQNLCVCKISRENHYFLAMSNWIHLCFMLVQIDHSIVESFGGEGKACITARVYPELAIDKKSHLYAFNYGTKSVKISSLRAWSMKKAQIVDSRDGRNPLIN